MLFSVRSLIGLPSFLRVMATSLSFKDFESVTDRCQFDARLNDRRDAFWKRCQKFLQSCIANSKLRMLSRFIG